MSNKKTIKFKLRFDEALIPKLARQYTYLPEFAKEDFKSLCFWKTPRSQSRVDSNPAEFIEDATRIALSTHYEELRIGVLTLLHGVS